MIRAAAILHWIVAVGFGVFCPPAIRSVMMGSGFPIVFGFPAYGGGPFERVGIRTTAGLLAAFLVVCILEAVAGALLWGNHRSGALLSFVLLPLGAVFWWGFALPIPPLCAAAWTALIVLGWQSLR